MNVAPDANPKTPAPAVAPAAGQTVGGDRYRLKKVLGQGGMGVVWLAHDTRLREPVALKFLPPHIASDPAALELLRRETLRSRKLSHPNIVRIHDLHENPGEPTFLSMEYVDGPNLHYLRTRRPAQVLSWKFLAPLVRQLCLALDYAHGEMVVHRDLKPANLMIDGSERLKLADFGMARLVQDAARRREGQIRGGGTLDYMSPQQADGHPPAVGDDLYAMGATLYELLTSTPPFYTGDLAYQVRTTRPDSLEQRLLDLGLTNVIPPDVSALILSCLAKDPAQRPPSARAILEWLDTRDSQEAAEPAVVTEPESSAPRARRAVVGTSLAILLLLALGGWWWLDHEPAIRHPGKNRFPTAASVQTTVDGHEILFNGRDLAGWEGDPRFWFVEGGAIVGRFPGPLGSQQASTCLFYRGRPADNFELRFAFRCVGGVYDLLYRAEEAPNYAAAGYVYRLTSVSAGALHERTLQGETRLLPMAVVTQGDKVAPSDNLFRTAMRAGEWNQVLIVAVGPHLRHELNGQVVRETMDNRASRPAGSLAIAMHFVSSVAQHGLQIKDLRLKRLPSVVPASLELVAPPPTNPQPPRLPIVSGPTNQVPPANLPPKLPAGFSQTNAVTPAAPPRSAFTNADFVNLFNGWNLSGWTGDPRDWSVDGGAIMGRKRDPNDPREDTFLWSTNWVGDFELRLLFRGEATAGIFYRGQYEDADLYAGYLARIGRGRTGWLLETLRHSGARVLTDPGRQTVYRLAGGKASLTVLRTVATQAQLDAALKIGDWNELVIVAQSNRLSHRLNGVTITEAIDEHPTRAHATGRVGLELSPRNTKTGTIQFKDLRLRPLGPVAPPVPDGR